MDYKYIQQLLDRYWECQTTLEEENILRTFFSQKDVPASLLPYRNMFLAEEQMKEEAHLSEDFDKRVLAKIEQQPTANVKAGTLSLSARFLPFYKAAAVVAIVLTIGMAAQHGWEKESNENAHEVALQPGDSTTMEILPATTAENVQVADSLVEPLKQ